jgi:carbon-monoxide dehydrogenase iron sulfur subunit
LLTLILEVINLLSAFIVSSVYFSPPVEYMGNLYINCGRTHLLSIMTSLASPKIMSRSESGAEEQREGSVPHTAEKEKRVMYVSQRWDLCVSCGLCEVACSMLHYGVIDRGLSRVRIYRYFTPLPKGLPVICTQCSKEERECEKACPVKPAAIYYDEAQRHMKVDPDRCLGEKCGLCRDACPAEIPAFRTPIADYPLVCDLCEKGGERRPQCVHVCPTGALEFQEPQFPQHLERIHPDERAGMIAKRFYPLPRDVPGYW